jgi:hypothetical protein
MEALTKEFSGKWRLKEWLIFQNGNITKAPGPRWIFLAEF